MFYDLKSKIYQIFKKIFQCFLKSEANCRKKDGGGKLGRIQYIGTQLSHESTLGMTEKIFFMLLDWMQWEIYKSKEVN